MPRKAPQVRSKVVPNFGVLVSEGDRRAWKPPDAALQRTPVPMSCAWIAGQEKSSTSLVVWPFQAAHTGASVGLPHPTLPLHPARLAFLLPPRHLAPEGGREGAAAAASGCGHHGRRGRSAAPGIDDRRLRALLHVSQELRKVGRREARAGVSAVQAVLPARELLGLRARRSGARMRARPRPRRARGAVLPALLAPTPSYPT